jgi:hypothetical protein
MKHLWKMPFRGIPPPVSHPGDNFRATEDISDGQDARLGATW